MFVEQNLEYQKFGKIVYSLCKLYMLVNCKLREIRIKVQ